jgi:hypothetical protein
MLAFEYPRPCLVTCAFGAYEQFICEFIMARTPFLLLRICIFGFGKAGTDDAGGFERHTLVNG